MAKCGPTTAAACSLPQAGAWGGVGGRASQPQQGPVWTGLACGSAALKPGALPCHAPRALLGGAVGVDATIAVVAACVAAGSHIWQHRLPQNGRAVVEVLAPTHRRIDWRIRVVQRNDSPGRSTAWGRVPRGINCFRARCIAETRALRLAYPTCPPASPSPVRVIGTRRRSELQNRDV